MPLLRLAAPLRPLELERRRDDADRERAELARDPRDDGRGAGAGAAALAGGDEDHVGAAQLLLQLVVGLLGRAAPDVGIGAGAEALRQLAADVDLDRRIARRSGWMSVLTATNSTCVMPASIIRLTALRPAPPTPTTLITAR